MLQKARYIINHKILSKFGKRESSPLARSMKLSATIVARIWVYAKSDTSTAHIVQPFR